MRPRVCVLSEYMCHIVAIGAPSLNRIPKIKKFDTGLGSRERSSQRGVGLAGIELVARPQLFYGSGTLAV